MASRSNQIKPLSHKSSFNWTQISRSKILFVAKTLLDGYTHERTIICRQLFASHVVAFQPMKRKRKMLLMIIYLIKFVVGVVNLIKR